MKLLALTFLIILTGCAASGPLYVKPDLISLDKASVYVYRPWHMKDGAGYANILVNGVKYFELRNNGYGLIELDPGKYTITASGSFLTSWMAPDVSVSIEVERGKEYYIKLFPVNTGVVFVGPTVASYGGASFDIVSQETANQEIIKTRKTTQK